MSTGLSDLTRTSIGLLLLYSLVICVASQENIVQSGKPAEPKNCCYGDGYLKHGEVVFNHAPHCFQLVCQNGFIQQNYVHNKGDMNCCEFNNLLYPNGTELAGFCMRLRCLNGTWVPGGKVEKCCDHCYLYNDPHIHTFDDHNYDWHGTCNYSIAQTGFALDPEVGVFGKFQNCNGQAACLSNTTFRNDPHTIINIFDREVLKPNVNGDYFNVDFNVQHLRSSSGKHSVLTWRYGGCAFLMGSSKLLLLHCRHRLDIWAHPVHLGKLNGLCGHYNHHINDDFTKRDNCVQRPLTYWPLAFPQSWLTFDQPDGSVCKRKSLKDTTTDPCNANATERTRYLDLCRGSLQQLNNVPGFQRYIENCAFDICMLRQAGGDDRQVQNWIGEVQTIITFVQKLI